MPRIIFLLAICVLLMSSIANAQAITGPGSGLNRPTAATGTLALGGNITVPTTLDYTTSTTANFLIKKATANYFFIGNNGNIGIGTITPANKFSLAGGIATNAGIQFPGLTSTTATTLKANKALALDSAGNIIWVNVTTNFANGVTGILPFANGGTGLGILGTANQQLRINAAGTALEYFTPTPANAWSLAGNANTTTSNFIGTTDAKSLFFRTNNINRFFIDSLTGNVGIGTTTAGSKLEIDNTAVNTSGLKFTRLTNASPAATGNGKLLTVDATGNVILVRDSVNTILPAWTLNGNTTGAIKNIGTIDNFDLPFITNNTERLRITNAGSVGIGTNNPLAQFNTTGTVKFDKYKNNTAGDSILTTDAQGNLKFKALPVTSYTFSNGLTNNNGNINFGGDLTGDTYIKYQPADPGVYTALNFKDGSGSPETNIESTTIGINNIIRSGYVAVSGDAVIINNGTPQINSNLYLTSEAFQVFLNAPGRNTIGNRNTLTIDTGAMRFNSNQFVIKNNGKAKLGNYINNTTEDSVLTTDVQGNLKFKAMPVVNNANNWSVTGNTGTDTALHFIGTRDLQHLLFKTNNIERMRITPGGNLLVGTGTDAGYNLDVKGTARIQGNLNVGAAILTSPNNSFFLSFNAPVTATGGGNVGIGRNAFQNLTTGTQNTGIGDYSSTGLTSGFGNTGVGAGSNQRVSTGVYNTALGPQALQWITATDRNIGIGSLSSKSDMGTFNIAIGNNLGSFLRPTTWGNGNIFIGGFTNDTSSTNNNNIVLGNNSYTSRVSNTTIIGTGMGTNVNNVVMLGSPTQNILIGAPNNAADNGAKLQVRGQLSVDTLTIGSNTDSIVVVNNNLFKKIAPSALSGGNSNLNFSNGLVNTDGTVKLGGALTGNTVITNVDSSLTYKFNDGSYIKTGNHRGYNGVIEQYGKGRYQIYNERSASASDWWNLNYTIDTVGKTYSVIGTDRNEAKFVVSTFSSFKGYNPFPQFVGSNSYRMILNTTYGFYMDNPGKGGIWQVDLLGNMYLHKSPLNGTALDSILVWDATTKIVKKVAQSSLGAGAAASSWKFDGNTVAGVRPFGTVDSFDLPVITNNTEKFRITSTGNIGIGTIAPTAQLHNTGSVRFGAFKNNTTEDSVLTTDINGNLKLKAFTAAGTVGGGNDVSKWVLKNTSILSKDSLSVGIGVDSATAKLHTKGSVRFEGLKNNIDEDSVLTTDQFGNLKMVYMPYGTTGSVGGGSGGAIYTFKNGITQVNGAVSFGGQLQDSVRLNLADYAFNINNGTQKLLSISGVDNNIGIGTLPVTAYKMTVNGDVSIGTKDSAGIGDKLWFNGKANNDKVWISRYNTAPGNTDLRVNIGAGNGENDKFIIGYDSANIWTSKFVVQNNGFAGVGTSQLTGELSIGTGHGNKLAIGNNSWAKTAIINTGNNGDANGDYTDILVPGQNSNNALIRMNSKGSVGIGTSVAFPLDADYRLSVNGKIRAKGLRVQTSGWADFVFEEGYKLNTLAEVEAYIKKYKHLPEMLPAEKVIAEGNDLGETQVKLLQKIEELTLYVIEQDKQLKKLEEKNKTLETQTQKIDDITKQLAALKALVEKGR